MHFPLDNDFAVFVWSAEMETEVRFGAGARCSCKMPFRTALHVHQ